MRTGARIVHCCGFDSIPSDLGALMVQEAFKERHGRYASEVKMAAGRMSGAFSGGTFASMLNIFEELKENPSLRKVLGNPYALKSQGHPRSGQRRPGRRPLRPAPRVDEPVHHGGDQHAHREAKPCTDGSALGRGLSLLRGDEHRQGVQEGLTRAAVLHRRHCGIHGLQSHFLMTRPWVVKRLPSTGRGPERASPCQGPFHRHVTSRSVTGKRCAASSPINATRATAPPPSCSPRPLCVLPSKARSFRAKAASSRPPRRWACAS